jgi:hypothetical protein
MVQNFQDVAKTAGHLTAPMIPLSRFFFDC